VSDYEISDSDYDVDDDCGDKKTSCGSLRFLSFFSLNILTSNSNCKNYEVIFDKEFFFLNLDLPLFRHISNTYLLFLISCSLG
jgi:hypothetical protein